MAEKRSWSEIDLVVLRRAGNGFVFEGHGVRPLVFETEAALTSQVAGWGKAHEDAKNAESEGEADG